MPWISATKGTGKSTKPKVREVKKDSYSIVIAISTWGESHDNSTPGMLCNYGPQPLFLLRFFMVEHPCCPQEAWSWGGWHCPKSIKQPSRKSTGWGSGRFWPWVFHFCVHFWLKKSMSQKVGEEVLRLVWLGPFQFSRQLDWSRRHSFKSAVHPIPTRL